LWINPGGRDIGVDSLTTQLVINRCLPHRADTLRAGLRGRQHRGVDRLWNGYEIGVYRLWIGINDEESADPTDQHQERMPPERGPPKPICISL
jgi:hypothetical protein